MEMALADDPAEPAAETAADSGREELVEKLRGMADCLERGEDAEFGHQLQTLLQRREAGFFQRIESLSGLLSNAFRLNAHGGHWQGVQLELPDTAARLDRVLHLTADAAHRTLDLAEQGQHRLTELSLALGELMDDDRPTIRTMAANMHTHCLALRHVFGELVQAQEYQDLSGQLLRRAGKVIREVEEGLSTLLSARPQARGAFADKGLQGPVVPGVTTAGADQADADALLAMFMSGP